MKKENTDTPKLSAKAYIRRMTDIDKMLKTNIISEIANIENVAKNTPEPQVYLKNAIIKYHESIVSNCKIIGLLWKITGWDLKKRNLFFDKVDYLLNENIEDIDNFKVLEAELDEFIQPCFAIDYCIELLETKYSKNDSTAINDKEPQKEKVAEETQNTIHTPLPNMSSIISILTPKAKEHQDQILRAIWEQWTMERDLQPKKGSRKPDTTKAATFYRIMVKAKFIEGILSQFYIAFNNDLGISASREAVNKAHSDSRYWDKTIMEDVEKAITLNLK